MNGLPTDFKELQARLSFYNGDGEMARAIRGKDWSSSTVGSPETWPQDLNSILGMMLASKFPMALFWGEAFIFFCNDRFCSGLTLDMKLPSVIGLKAEHALSETWPAIRSDVEGVFVSGEAIGSEDRLMSISRNGNSEEFYWTFCLSPLFEPSGKTNGVLLICTDTSGKIKTLGELSASKEELEFAIDANQLGTFDYDPIAGKFSSNGRLKHWFGLPASEQIALHHAINAIAEYDRQRVTEAIFRALDYSSGGIYDIEYTIIHPTSNKETIVHAGAGPGSTIKNAQFVLMALWKTSHCGP